MVLDVDVGGCTKWPAIIVAIPSFMVYITTKVGYIIFNVFTYCYFIHDEFTK